MSDHSAEPMGIRLADRQMALWKRRAREIEANLGGNDPKWLLKKWREWFGVDEVDKFKDDSEFLQSFADAGKGMFPPE